MFPGISITEIPVRSYTKGNLASHILGYTSKIDENEYKSEKENGYTLTDYYGKAGIERIAEKYLKGTDRNKTNRYGSRWNNNRRIYTVSLQVGRIRYNSNNRCILTNSNRKCISKKYRKHTKWKFWNSI